MTDRMVELRKRLRCEHIEIEVDGIPVDCWYYLDGDYYPGNEIDPPERPTAVLVRAEIGGVNVTEWDDTHEFTWHLEKALSGEAA